MRAVRAAVDVLAEAIAAARCGPDIHLHNGPGRSATEQPGVLEGPAQRSAAARVSAADEICIVRTRRLFVSKVSLVIVHLKVLF